MSLEIECDFINVSFCTSLLAVLNYFMKLVENGSMNATSSLVSLSSPNFEQVKMLCSPVVSIVKVIALACFSVKTLTDGRGSLFSPPFLGDQY